MKANRSIKNNEAGNVNMVLTAVVAAVIFAISIPIAFSVLAGVNVASIDSKLTGDPAKNAILGIVNNTNTFYSIGPIYIIVIAAVGIIGAVMMIAVGKRS